MGRTRRVEEQAPGSPGRRWRRPKGLALGAVVAVVGLATGLLPAALDLEEAVALRALFAVRGARPAPADVVVVSIDRESADPLALPRDAARWPRSMHAELTDRLVDAGAAVIVFDIFFPDPGTSPEDDARFARAIERAGNVVLAEYVAREVVPLAGPAAGAQASIERVLPPLPMFAEAAVGTAPFLLPKLPVRVSQFWTFKTGAGDIPTLPVIALHLFARDAHAELVGLLDRRRPGVAAQLPRDGDELVTRRQLQRTVAAIREVVRGLPPSALATGPRGRAAPAGGLSARGPETRPQDRVPDPSPPDRARALLPAVVRTYQAPDALYLDFYGPSRTIATVPYHRLVRPGDPGGPDMPDLRGKAVFIGVSGLLRLEQKDAFHTVFSDPSGQDLSGVEIAATAFANLLEGRHVRPLTAGAHALVLAVGGLAVGFAGRALPPLVALGASVGAGAVYVAIAYAWFAADGTWLPLVVPLLVQLPLAVGGGVLWHYVDTNRERREIRRAFANYLPDPVIEQLLLEGGQTGARSRLVHGTCLYTDAERYTTLAERLEPDALAELMNRYYATVFEPVRRRGGIISDIVGDSALAIWAAPADDAVLRAQACGAACEILQAVEEFNRTHPGLNLTTRIGLHAGAMVLGHVGAGDHYEYRAVGDIVNTASRLEGLNKQLGTRVLVSEEVVTGVDGFLTRRLGRFVLAGKSRPVAVHELVCPRSRATPSDLARCAHFARALEAYQAQAWEEAAEGLTSLLEHLGDDGPARFYLDVCAHHRGRQPDPAWDPVVQMEAK
jgi:adenylate cyclase